MSDEPIYDNRGLSPITPITPITLEECDPTAHAEVVALRRAARRVGADALRGSTLVATGEPCAMCYVVAHFAGVRRVIFALDRHEAASAGFDYRGSYALLASAAAPWSLDVMQLRTPNAMVPFQSFSR